MRWYAKLSNGDVQVMTLDELDVAYENGVIDARTLVLAPEATEWAQLGELASLGDAENAAPNVARVPIATPSATHSRSKKVALALAIVTAGTFIAAGFEAQQAGAFSRRRVAIEEVPSPRRAQVTAIASALDAPVPDRAPRALATDTERRQKRDTKPANLPRSAETAPSTTGQTQVFTSGGSRYDPLNTDLP